jgi:hypothetical protein
MSKNLIQKIQQKFNLDTILKVISVLCIFYVLDDLRSGLMESIHDRVELSNFLNFFLKTLQNIIFGTLLVTIFTQFKYRYIGFVAPFAYMEQSHNWFYQVHYFLLEKDFYSLFSKNPSLISPEYPRVITIFGIVIISFILLFTRWRNFKRIFVTFGAGGVFFTALLFHFIIIYEIESFKEQDSSIMQSIAFKSDDTKEINKSCIHNDYNCFYFPKSEKDSFYEDKDIPVSIKKLLPYFKDDLKNNKEFYWYGISHDPNAKNRIIGQTPFAIAQTEDFILIIRNANSYKNFLVVNQYAFVWLALASHTIWFFGSLFLIFFHEKRFKKRSTQSTLS